jgi:hypothetical protein
MNGYEQILSIMRDQGSRGNPESIQIGIMDGPDSCSIGKLKLSRGDLLIAEHLITGYHCAVDNEIPSKQDTNTFIKCLQKGDRVAIYRISDELYIILERLV